MSEKPWWQGKTCKELENTRVKVTYKNGAAAEGRLDEYGDIDVGNDISARVSVCGSKDQCFALFGGVASIERLDDPDYERVSEDRALNAAFENGPGYAVLKNGNRGRIMKLQINSLEPNKYWLTFSDDPESDSVMVYGSEVDHFEIPKPKPQLPDKPGLWVDKDGSIWTTSSSATYVKRIYNNLNHIWSWMDDSQQTNNENCLAQYAPFRPFKPEENHE